MFYGILNEFHGFFHVFYGILNEFYGFFHEFYGFFHGFYGFFHAFYGLSKTSKYIIGHHIKRTLTLLHLKRQKLYAILVFLGAIGLRQVQIENTQISAK